MPKVLYAVGAVLAVIGIFLLDIQGQAQWGEETLASRRLSGDSTICDLGPNAPAIPPEAQAAGFTHCAGNWDFSQPLYAMLSNWFDCDGSGSTLLWHKGSAGVSFPNPCNIYQYNDNGIKVIRFEWLTSYSNKGYNVTGIPQSNQIGGQTFNNFTKTPSFTVGNYYIEVIDRLDGSACFSCPQNSGGPNDVYMWGQFGDQEIDIQEFNKDSGRAASGSCCAGFRWTNWGPGRNAIPGRYSIFTYHKYSVLVTSDGATVPVAGCRRAKTEE
jgi:hypothetical protein